MSVRSNRRLKPANEGTAAFAIARVTAQVFTAVCLKDPTLSVVVTAADPTGATAVGRAYVEKTASSSLLSIVSNDAQPLPDRN